MRPYLSLHNVSRPFALSQIYKFTASANLSEQHSPPPKHSHNFETTSSQSSRRHFSSSTTSNSTVKSIYIHQDSNQSTSSSNTTNTSRSSDTMPHSYNNSISSNEGERIYYNPRRENRDRKEPRSHSSREVVIHNHPRSSSGEPARTSGMQGGRWK